MRDLDELISWHSDWSSLRVAVLGLGVSGFSAADTLAELGASVLVVAGRPDDERAEILQVLGVPLVIEPDATVIPDELVEHEPELIIVSPGYPREHALTLWATERGIPIWGDIELAWRLRDKTGTPAEWISITGTNGKTTTAQLTSHLLNADGRRAAAVGNIGVPVLDAIRYPAGFDVLVVELSSFQLHWIPREGAGAPHPIASVCLNLDDDHLDWHGGATAYAEAKGTVYFNTKLACIYNRADQATMHMVEEADVEEGCRAIGFGLDTPGPSDLGIVDGIIVDRAFHDDRHRSALELTTHGELAAAGLGAPHMVQNALAASALVRAVGVAPAVVRDGLASFRVDRHRTELIATAAGVQWVDDSKATNAHAARASLTAFGSVVWIVGGLTKGVDLSPLIAEQATRLRAAIVIGADRTDILDAFARHAPGVPVIPVEATDTESVMPLAVNRAAEVALEGDVVLLAPAAASMDQFVDYADRGNRFATAVAELLGGAADDHNEPSPGGTGPTPPSA